MAEPAPPKFLDGLTKDAEALVSAGSPYPTERFCELCDKILPVFDYLGPVIHFAKHDMTVKTASLRESAASRPTLQLVVDEDKKAGTYAVKNSCARNLHRLVHVLLFLVVIFEKLAESPTATLKDAVWASYQVSLHPLHTYVVQTAVWAGLYILPTRESFLQHIGETEQTAKAKAMALITYGRLLVADLLKLYDEPMPASTDTRVA